jgi:hypothetical protein
MTHDALTGTYEGGCMCGATRFAFTGPPKFISNCHCKACRDWTGAPTTAYVGGRDDQTSWSGAAPANYHSSPGVDRLFCPTCGTALAYRGEKWAGETHLLLGAFDDPDVFQPVSVSFTEEALAWWRPDKR